jgi:hypothetical protein
MFPYGFEQVVSHGYLNRKRRRGAANFGECRSEEDWLKTDRAYAWRSGRLSTRATLDEPSRLTNDLAEDYLALGQAESTPDRTLIRRSCNRHA